MEEVNFDLSQKVMEGRVPLGYIAGVKVLRPDGSLGFHVVIDGDMNNFEAVGLLQHAIQGLQAEMFEQEVEETEE